ncbi:hypothetical protein [Aeromicrobium wangtongii]|uniref:ABC-2 type transport system permease protein n=1 Tax=Aeromicrobium wangtongii TaxID=2969247 RepID=A0ABY5M2W5_9ACTN|nr:hypothetical protein [Aeromicrobium wangtongii]MCD9198522.1 hypothetical protein [Aeromicrobium wangtongii]UUP12548.1 hypothetical protein NQV15_11860 [Aeromicrobium wangtongii]
MTKVQRTTRDAGRARAVRTMLRRASGPLAHLSWAIAAVGQVVGVWLFDESEDFGAGMIVWTVTGLLFGVVTTTVVQAGAPSPTRTGRRGRPRSRSGRPWDSPAVFGYLAICLVGLLVSPTAFAYGALMLLLTGLGGVCVWLVFLLQLVCWTGLRGFGSILFRGVPQGEEGSRWLALGPFVATVGASLWFLPILGCLAYDSPGRRDLLPLVGVVGDGVEITHPALLLIGQVGTALVLGLIGLGALLSAATARLRP